MNNTMTTSDGKYVPRTAVAAVLVFSIISVVNLYHVQNAFAATPSLAIMCNSSQNGLVYLVSGFPVNTEISGVIFPELVDESGNLIGTIVNGFVDTTNIYGTFRMDRPLESIPEGWTLTLTAVFAWDSNSDGVFDTNDQIVRGQIVNNECPSFTPAQQTENIVNLVYSIGLPQKITTDLQKPVLQAQKILTDSNAGNDSNACSKVNSFNGKVRFYENKGQLTSLQAGELRYFSSVLSTSLGC